MEILDFNGIVNLLVVLAFAAVELDLWLVC